MSIHPSTRPRAAQSSPAPAHDQSQSPLFTALPLDIRREIYLQLWLECGITQHIYTFGKNSYLQSYSCILDPGAWDRNLTPPAEETTDSSSSSETQAPAADGGEHQPADEQQQEQPQQPQPQDDPGDIDGAIQDIVPGPDGPTRTIDDGQPNTPWCLHKACFERWIEKWDRSFERAYSACYRSSFAAALEGGGGNGGNGGGGGGAITTTQRQRRRPDVPLTSTLLLPLLVCKRMYKEAGESMFSNLGFSFLFSGVDTVNRLLGGVPVDLTERIRFVDVMTSSPGLFETPPPLATLVQTVCRTIQDTFPNLRELRLTLHPARPRTQIPPAETFAPLYDLARSLPNLRKFEIRLPCLCEKGCPIGYGGAPEFLRDAPFTTALVPQGWHDTGHCDSFVSP